LLSIATALVAALHTSPFEADVFTPPRISQPARGKTKPIPGVSLGTYIVRVERASFKTVVTDTTVAAPDAKAERTLQLQVAASSETVEVFSAPPSRGIRFHLRRRFNSWTGECHYFSCDGWLKTPVWIFNAILIWLPDYGSPARTKTHCWLLWELMFRLREN